MAKKAQSQAPQRALTRKQLSRAEREALVRRRILIGAGVLLGLVLLVLAAGVVQSQFIAPKQPVARVHGEVITTREYQQWVNFERWRLRNAMVNIQAQAAQVPSDDPSASFIRQIVQQQLQQLQQQYSFVGSQVLEDMIAETLIRQKAAELGISASDEEVAVEIERQIAAQLGAIRPDDATATATAAAEATATAQSWTPTPEPTPTATLTTETAAITQTATPPPPTPTLGPTATPNLLTSEAFEEQYREYLDTMRRETGITEAQYRERIRTSILIEKLQAYFADQVPTEEEQVYVRQVLLPTEEEANQAKQEIEGGKSFEEVARALAAKQAGDLGFIERGDTVAEFEEVAFSLEPGTISDPVQSEYGWHVIEVLEREGEGDEMRVHARHILVDTEEEANQIKEELENGADFGELALDRSRDASPPQRTDFGWITRDTTVVDPAVAMMAFNLERDLIGGPIQARGTQWALLEVVEGPEVRPLDETTLERKRSEAFQDWLDEAKAGEGVERLWDTDKVPADPFL